MNKLTLFTLLISVSILFISYFGLITYKINKGFFQGYANTELDIDIADYICFYYRIGIYDVIKVGKEAHNVKSLNFGRDSVENAWELIKSLNSIKKRIQPCLSGLRKAKEDEATNLDLFKKIGKKFLEFIPFADQIKKGVASIELALEFKNLVDLINKFRLSSFDSILSIHETSEVLATAIGRLTFTMEELLNIEDFKIIESIIDILSKGEDN